MLCKHAAFILTLDCFSLIVVRSCYLNKLTNVCWYYQVVS